MFAVFIQDGHDMSGRAHSLQHAKLTLADKRPAGATVADEFDDENPGAFERGEFESPPHSSHRRFFVAVGLFFGGQQAVQVHAGVGFSAVGQKVVQGVNFEDLDQQGLYVFYIQIQGHFLVGREKAGVCRREVQGHPLFELFDEGGVVEFGYPALGVGTARQEFGFRHDAQEAIFFHDLLEAIEVVGRAEKEPQEVLDELPVVSHGAQGQVGPEILVQLGQVVAMIFTVKVM